MSSSGANRDQAMRVALAVLLVVTALAFFQGGRFAWWMTGYDNFTVGFIIRGLEDAQPFLLAAAVLFAGRVLGDRYRFAVAGAVIIAGASLATQGVLASVDGIWPGTPFYDPNLGALAVYRNVNLGASAVEVVGWLLVAWGVGSAGWRMPRGRVHRAVLPVAALAAIADATGVSAGLATPPSPDQAQFVAIVTLTMMLGITARGTAAVAALAVAGTAGPLDWRWAVGAGLAIALFGGAALQWSIILDAPRYAVAAGWWTPLRTVSAAGGLLAAAGFAFAVLRGPGLQGPIDAGDPVGTGSATSRPVH